MSDITKLPSQIVVRGQIADASGHTEFSGSIDEAMNMIMNHVTKLGKWVYVNGNPFSFTNHSIAEQNELRNMLETSEDPTFMLTAKLQGGAVKMKTRVVKSPLSAVLSSRTRAHLAVSLGSSGGTPTIDILVSDFKGSKKKLADHKREILSALFEALK